MKKSSLIIISAYLLSLGVLCARGGEAPSVPADVRQGPQVLKANEQGVGRYIPDLTVVDVDGNSHKLSDFRDAPAIVVALTGTGCPLCQKYAPTLAELEKRYREQSVRFVFVNPNESESAEKLKQAVATHGFEGPYVRDPNDVLLRTLDARTTTEAFVLDAARTLVYRGAVDDQYGFAYALDAPRETYLADALDAVLAGRVPEVAATSAPGCELYYDRDAAPATQTEVTYHNRISRIFQNSCLECHRDGGLAPFALETYEEASDYAGMIEYVVEQGVMPPWFAAPHDGDRGAESDEVEQLHWANDRSLAAAEKTDLLAWVEAGAPEGNPADAPLPRQFADDWRIGEPDLVVQIPDEIAVKATGRMPYQYARVETSFEEDRWVKAVEIQPTDRAVVHHVLVFINEKGRGGGIDEEGGFFAAYVPGNTFQQYPDRLAKRLPAGSTLVFQLHYTPNGVATTDQTRLGIVFADAPPEHAISNVGIANHRISIPPGADNHPEQASIDVPTEVRLLAVMPHMHLRGKAFRYDLVLPDGERQTLLDVPRYDFNWQLEYRLAEPLDVPKGSRIEVTGWFDNSKDNPANPDPTETVRWGPQTEDEMLLGYVEYYIPGDTVGRTSPPGPKREAPTVEFLEKAFRRADRNGDGKVTTDELPRKELFERLDRDNDGVLTRGEVRATASRGR